MTTFVDFVWRIIGSSVLVLSSSKPVRLCLGVGLFVLCNHMSAQMIAAPSPQTGTIIGTVEDLNEGPVPGAKVSIQEKTSEANQGAVADAEGFFTLINVPSAIPIHLVLHADGFEDWTSESITLTPGQQYDLTGIRLSLTAVETSVNAIMPEQLAIEQVKAEEKQRIFGVIPNFYVVYDHNPMPLSAKLKFQLAFKASTDVATIGGTALFAGIYQAADTPAYQQGLKGYGQRFGAIYANGFSDILIGGAVLPSLLHQDPRYFYQGTGSTKSRVMHAMSAPFVARGDDGRSQFNYSSIGGDLASGALSNLYYPASDRGASLVFTGALLTTGGRIANALAQEFLFSRLAGKSRSHD